ncbi:dihydrofolate reductase family protein [Oceanimonas baumannii]|uniref:Dihydrofolate reductase n=1 Tax=Oceanimonas baumannii TaxID=129578 RepID=A0A235C970_9GAMM|nr:dihydrofolate reductase family protein [Oceanimonas baumannii]OYD21181.1 dihydrofolate reductase [Oceanimonas baumannii]TDW55318.1 dihydrofolate reductase [Oceanimonas baumannii]
MKCSVFIATSADGYIATIDGGIDWLETSGKTDIDLGDGTDMGFNSFIASVDCMIMGRGCMEKLASFNLTPEQWPYGTIRIIALSRSVKEVPGSLKGKVELHSGDVSTLVSELETAGFKKAYIDGGATITSFLNAKLINEITITQAPILLGNGKPLFGLINHEVKLKDAKATVFGNDFIQVKYEVSYL